MLCSRLAKQLPKSAIHNEVIVTFQSVLLLVGCVVQPSCEAAADEFYAYEVIVTFQSVLLFHALLNSMTLLPAFFRELAC